MRKRFGEGCYAENEEEGSEDEDEEGGVALSKRKKGPKNPKRNYDIDIKDLVPDYRDEKTGKPASTLTDEEDNDEPNDQDSMSIDGGSSSTMLKTRKECIQERSNAKRASRKQRSQIEFLIDTELSIAPTTTSFTAAPGHSTLPLPRHVTNLSWPDLPRCLISD